MALCLSIALSSSAAGAQASPWADIGGEPASRDVVRVAGWVMSSGDNDGLPFVIIDKVAAKAFLFVGDGRLGGAAPVLIGFARGDVSAPGIGDREMSHIRPAERVTPAGRFVAAFGRAPGEKQILWVDRDAAVSLHPVSTSNPKEQRLQRLRTPTPRDNRISYGCINVPTAFYDRLVRPAFTGSEGIVYILPEALPLGRVFPSLRGDGDVVAPLPVVGGPPE